MNVLCALICRGTHVLAEYDQSDGEEDLCELCRGIILELTASVRESRQYVVRGYSINYVTSGDLTYVCVTRDLPDTNAVAISFLRDLKAKTTRTADMSSM